MLILNGKEFIEYDYKGKENELERDIVANSKLIFGEKTVYIDVKHRIHGEGNKNSSVPDGYLLDYTDEKEPRLYVIECETQYHGVRDHIAPQITQFGLNFSNAQNDIKKTVINGIEDKELLNKVAINANYRNVDDMFDHIITNDKFGVIIPIDETYNDLEKSKILFSFKIETLQFKKFINGNDTIYQFETFYDKSITSKTNNIKEINTVIVPADIDGFQKEFIGQNCWYAISIGINMLDKIKYIAAYEKSPTAAIRYYAEVDRIELYEDSGKYIIYFKDKAKKLPIPIKLNPNHPSKAPQGRVYTNFDKLINANSQTTLDDLF